MVPPSASWPRIAFTVMRVRRMHGMPRIRAGSVVHGGYTLSTICLRLTALTNFYRWASTKPAQNNYQPCGRGTQTSPSSRSTTQALSRRELTDLLDAAEHHGGYVRPRPWRGPRDTSPADRPSAMQGRIKSPW